MSLDPTPSQPSPGIPWEGKRREEASYRTAVSADSSQSAQIPFASHLGELDIGGVNALRRTVRPPAARRREGGFTLVEAALTMVIIGTGVVAMLQLLAAGTMSNSSAAELTTAVQLANNCH